MDITTLITESKARFSHNSAKEYLKDKYASKLIVADQGGLWKADLQTINFLRAEETETTIIIDTFDNPVKVNREALLNKLSAVYNETMSAWHAEWAELEKKR